MARLLSMKESKEFAVIAAFAAGQITTEQALEHLGVHRSTLWRLKNRARGGPGGLAHGLRGKKGNRKADKATRQAVCRLYDSEYRKHGFGPRHFFEHAAARFPKPVPYSTLWRWLREEGLYARTRRSRKHRSRRPRKECFGELVQMDTSIHDWFGTGEKACLVSAVDDATGHVVGAFFNRTDTVLANMRVLKTMFEGHGLPVALYVDRSPIFKFTRSGIGRIRRPRYSGPVLTQVEQALETLGVELIHAYTPQAKGRIERLFGTWQSRLVPELSMAGIKDIDSANAFVERTFLPAFNRRFAQELSEVPSAFVPKFEVDLDRILVERYPRVVTNDHVISCAPAKLNAKILPGKTRQSYAKTKVEVLRHIDGSCSIYFGDEKLKFERMV
jgi:hypothetical protein